MPHRMKGVFVPLVCKDRLERMKQIGIEIGKGDYDIVFLQEIWLKSDYQLLLQYTSLVMPFSHYYYGGIIGSGLCLFSKHKILETSQFRYSLNGYAHRLMCGDWLADKCVGFAKLLIQPGSIKLNAYTTHLHAQYSEDNTYHSYDEHRCLQAFELAKFVRDTSSSCDCIIMAGDFNICPHQVGYDIITSIGNVQDTWKSQKDPLKANNEEATCCRRDNYYFRDTKEIPVRIDYIFHRNNAGCEMECVDCGLTMGKIEGQEINYSDHEGVKAEIIIKKNLTAMSNTVDNKESVAHLKKSIEVLQNGSKRVKTVQKLWLLLSVIILLGYVYKLLTNYQQQQHLIEHFCLKYDLNIETFQQNNLVLDVTLKEDFQKFKNQQHQLHQPLTSQQIQQQQRDEFNLLYSCMNGFVDQKLYFFLSELLKILSVVLLIFSLVHSCLVLSRELIIIKSTIIDMEAMINSCTDSDS